MKKAIGSPSLAVCGISRYRSGILLSIMTPVIRTKDRT